MLFYQQLQPDCMALTTSQEEAGFSTDPKYAYYDLLSSSRKLHSLLLTASS